MGAWMQRHRMKNWLGRLLVVLFLTSSWGAQAATTETVDAIYKYAYANDYIYSTSLEAAQAWGVYYNTTWSSYYMVTDISCPGSDNYDSPYCIGHVYGLRSATDTNIDFGIFTVIVYSRLFCPIPTVNPTVLYRLVDIQNKKCSRPIQVNYSITLSGGTEVEPWNKVTDADHKQATLKYTATVMDDSKQPAQPAPNVEVTITTEVDEYSGGHIHNTDRPKGKLAIPSDPIKDGTETITGKTNSNGVYSFVFGAEEASGMHTITAKCTGCQAPATAPVDVKVDGLQPIPATPFLYSLQLPNRDTNHPATFFLTNASIEKLRKVALYYYLNTYTLPKKGVVPDFVLNDASLEWGGVLDCYLTCNSAQYPSTPWHKHHVEHRRGSVVDIKANGTPGTIVYDKIFRSFAKKFGVDVGALHGSGSGLHYHLRLNNGAKE